MAPGAAFEFIAHLPEWRLHFPIPNGEGGLPSVRPEPGNTVWGAIFSVGKADLAALDVAASDALARTQGLSLALLFGERIRTDIPVNATIGAGTPAEVASQAEGALRDGFGCVKLKVGSARTPDEERERVAALRRVLGRDVRLRLDANGAWSESHAPSFIRALEAYDEGLRLRPGCSARIRTPSHSRGYVRP